MIQRSKRRQIYTRCMIPPMKRNVTRYLLTGLALIFFPCCMTDAQEPPQWGEVTDGLRLSLSEDYSRHELIFSIENVATHTQIANLGFNGMPVQLTVTFTSKDGKIRGGELGMSSAMFAMGMGVHEDIVEILPKSTYMLRHAMDDFVLMPKEPAAPNVFPLTTLKPGDLITGHLHGKYKNCLTDDCRKHETCWTGDLASNTVIAQ